jgi:integrase
MVGRMRRAVKIDLPHIVVDFDRRGNLRVYVRIKGRPKTRLRDAPGTPEFLAAYHDAVDGRVSRQRRVSGERRPEMRAGTLGWLARQYFGSVEFRRDLEPQTQATRRHIVESCLSEPVRPGSPDIMGDCPLPLFTDDHVRRIRDVKADKPGAARNRVRALSAMFAWGIEARKCKANPTRDVPARMPKTQGFHTWTPDEIARFEARHPVGSQARLAMALLAFTGQRRGDVVTFGRQHERDGWLTFVQRKTRKNNPDAMSVPILPELRAVLDASKTGDLTYLVTAYKLPFTAAGFGNRFRTWCDQAGLPHCSAHGLRKAGATVAAERGATDAQLMAIFGWAKAEMAAHYRRAANQKALAGTAVHLLAREQKEDVKCPTPEAGVSHSAKKASKIN